MIRPLVGYRQRPITGATEEEFTNPFLVSGFRLVDARAAYGFGLTTFAIGFPVHLDWSWPTLFNRSW